MNILDTASLSHARSTAKRTMADVFAQTRNTRTSTSYGYEEAWTAVAGGEALRGRLTPRPAEVMTDGTWAYREGEYLVAIESKAVIRGGDRLTRASDGAVFVVTGLRSPQSGDDVVVIAEVTKEVR